LFVNIFVGSLAFTTREDDLKEAFSTHGEVTSARIITDRDSGRSRGFAFVEMPNDDEARKAIDALNGTDFDGRAINVNEARPRENRGGGGGGGRNRW
jgi:RNA recognition motif-containing protein